MWHDHKSQLDKSLKQKFTKSKLMKNIYATAHQLNLIFCMGNLKPVVPYCKNLNTTQNQIATSCSSRISGSQVVINPEVS